MPDKASPEQQRIANTHSTQSVEVTQAQPDTDTATRAEPQQRHPTARALHHKGLQRQQQSRGNGYITQHRGKQRSAVVQRDPLSTNSTAAEANSVAADERPTDEFFNRNEVEQIRARTMVRYGQIAALVGIGQRAIERSRTNMLLMSERYEAAYAQHAAIAQAGRSEAQNQERWKNIVIGVALGTLASVAAAAVVAAIPAAAGAAAFSGTWLAVQGGSAFGSAVVSTGLSDVTSRATETAGVNLESNGLSPAMLESQIWRSLEALHRHVYRLSEERNNLFLMHGASEYAIGEIRAHVGGSSTDMTDSAVLDMVGSLIASDRALRSLDTALPSALAAMQQLEQQTNAPPNKSVAEIEQDIWIMWMSSISDDNSDILDLDAIEDHLHRIGVLGESSRLGVSFGSYTSEDDERAALQAARAQAGGLQASYEQLGAPAPQ